MEFDGIGDEILEQLAHLVRIDLQGRQGLMGDFRLFFPNQGLDIVKSSLEDIFISVDVSRKSALPDPGES